MSENPEAPTPEQTAAPPVAVPVAPTAGPIDKPAVAPTEAIGAAQAAQSVGHAPEKANVEAIRQQASEGLQAGVIPAPEAETYMTFVAAEEFNNTRFLARQGTAIKAPILAGSTSGIVPLITREGDLFAEFHSGVLVTKVPEVIEWCKAHPSVCRDATDPRTPGWATLKAMQAPKANREAALGREIDVDAMAFPELPGASVGDGAGAAAVASVPSGGDVGQQAVASALNTQSKLEAVEAERASGAEEELLP